MAEKPIDLPYPQSDNYPPDPSSNKPVNNTVLSVIAFIACAHFINDTMQSMLPALYPLLHANYQLSYLQIGIITAVYQFTGSVLQPLIGFFTDKRPFPYLLPFSAIFTLSGVLTLAYAASYHNLLLGAALIGFGSSIFHPEAARVTRLASGGRYGFAQSIFQVGGNSGTALGPLIAALFICFQERIAWLAPFTLFSALILTKIANWYGNQLKNYQQKTMRKNKADLSKNRIAFTITILILLMFTKYIYLAAIQNYYTFYNMQKFGLTIHQAQLMLFLYLFGVAIGTIFGGPIGDRIGSRKVILISILGVLPFTILLPFAPLYLSALLSFIIGAILASAFPAIVVFAQELLPNKVGTITGFLFGLAFGIGGIAATLLGWLGDIIGLEQLFILCAFLPAFGIIALFLPKLELLK